MTLRSPTVRWVTGVVAAIAVLGLLRFKPWQRGGTGEADATGPSRTRQKLAVGFLPVT